MSMCHSNREKLERIKKELKNIDRKELYFDENGFPRALREEDILKILRLAYKYIDNADYQKSLNRFFKEYSPVSYPTIMRYAHKSDKIRYALDKIRELNEIRLIEKCYTYLEDLKEWLLRNKEVYNIGEYFELRPEFTRRRIESLVKQNEALGELWEDILAIQENRLVKGIIENKFNKGMIFVLKNMHGWSERAESEDKEFVVRVEKEVLKQEALDVGWQHSDDEKIIKLEGSNGEESQA